MDRVIKIDAFVGAYPEMLLLILCQTEDGVAPDAAGVVRIIAELAETGAIKPIEPVARAKPHEPFCILCNAGDGIAGYAVPHLVITEIVRLGLQDTACEKEPYYA
jgi:hypothetical protein